MTIYEKGKLCKEASYEFMQFTNTQKNEILNAIATQLEKQKKEILLANQQDIKIAEEKGKAEAFIDRLMLNEKRLDDIISGVKEVMELEDPCHVLLEEWDHNDLHFKKQSVPIGVIGIIYEARPNVSVDAAALCLKSGNAVFLRGSSDTLNSNKALVKAMKDALVDCHANEHLVELVEDTSREVAKEFMRMNDYLDLLIPRGGANLIRTTVENASVPIIETGTGNCHIYVDKEAKEEYILPIIINAKTQRISVCNACESLLIHKDKIDILPSIIKELKKHDVIIHGCEITKKIYDSILLATNEDYAKEYLNYEISIKVVDNIQEAITHINKYSTKHSESIITENKENAQFFMNAIDSAVVYVNASTRFSDGNIFGFGAEIGISTQKVHARGPMGLKALTTYKYLVEGQGNIRN